MIAFTIKEHIDNEDYHIGYMLVLDDFNEDDDIEGGN